ncbi:amidohydrolase family protein [Aquibium microcysteis]|uniref:amidohydrolase family protein n=1 Tax=Aquibium microcysteis TaxID=675281 RepID=UPI00165D2EB4|nr:amidohydrolase family protein [Aquibium microcysteis]
MADLLLFNARDSHGRRIEAAVADGRVWLQGRPSAAAERIDCGGGRLMPGLCDHHIHLMASAAALSSLDVSGLGDDAFAERLGHAARQGPVRAIGADNADRLDADALDRIAGSVPVRVQARTGGLWVLNSAALDQLEHRTLPDAFERDRNGRPTGRVWRGDAFLRHTESEPPDLAALGSSLAGWGVTALTDASVTTDDRQADILASSGLPQRLNLMSGGSLRSDPRWTVSARKIVLDDRALPAIGEVADRIGQARVEGRPAAIHAVTYAELAVALAAYESVGAHAGDRIEHGAMIPVEAIPIVAALGLTVVSNPGFVAVHGDRYIREVPEGDHCDLYRLESLRRVGIPLAAGSDSPYGPLNPWAIMRAASDRRTAAGRQLGGTEALHPEHALGLHCPAPDLRDGDEADLVVLAPGAQPGLDLDPVAMTMIAGRLVHRRSAPGGTRPGEPQ